MKKINWFLSVVLCLVLIGCGGGSSGNNSMPPSNASNTIKVTNSTGFDMARAQIKTKSGSILQDESFNCPANQVCYLANNGSQFSEPVDLYFYDQKGVLGNVFLMADVPTPFVGLIAKPAMMGVYAYNKLVTDFAFNRQMLFERLDQFFANYDSPDGVHDSFEELGLYYRYKVTRGGMAEADFYADMNTRLLNNETGDFTNFILGSASQNSNFNGLLAYFQNRLLAPHFNLVGEAYAQEAGSCPAGLNAFIKFTGVVFDFFPIPGANTLVDTAGELVTEACDGTSDQLSKIYTDIQLMKTKLSAIENAVGEIKTLLATNMINTETKSYEQAFNLVNSAVSNYSDIVSQNKKSFKAFVEDQGGLDKVLDPNNTKAIGARDLIKSIQGGTDNSSIFVVMSQNFTDTGMANLASALDSECSNEATMQGDIIAKRVGCNFAITRAVTYLAATQGNALPMIKDVFETLATYTNSIPKPTGVSSWATGYEAVRKQFNDRTSLMLDKFKGPATGDHRGFYVPLKGLPEQLKSRLVAINCYSQEKGGQPVPFVTSWSGGPNGNDAYIETICRLGAEANGYQFKSRYYFGSVVKYGGLEPVNMMGVPMAPQFITNHIAYSGWTTTEYQSNDLRMILPKSISGSAGARIFAMSVGSNLNQPKNGVYLPSYGTNTCEFEKKTPPFQLNGFYDYLTSGGCSNDDEFDFVRYTDSFGYSYLWKFETSRPGNAINFRMGCLSAGCQIVNANHRLSFDDGPKDIWFYKPTRFKDNGVTVYGYEVDGKNLFPN